MPRSWGLDGINKPLWRSYCPPGTWDFGPVEINTYRYRVVYSPVPVSTGQLSSQVRRLGRAPRLCPRIDAQSDCGGRLRQMTSTWNTYYGLNIWRPVSPCLALSPHRLPTTGTALGEGQQHVESIAVERIVPQPGRIKFTAMERGGLRPRRCTWSLAAELCCRVALSEHVSRPPGPQTHAHAASCREAANEGCLSPGGHGDGVAGVGQVTEPLQPP